MAPIIQFTLTGGGAPALPTQNTDGSYNITCQYSFTINTILSDKNGSSVQYTNTGISCNLQPGYLLIITPNATETPSLERIFFAPVYLRGTGSVQAINLTSLLVRGNTSYSIVAGMTVVGIGILIKMLPMDNTMFITN